MRSEEFWSLIDEARAEALPPGGLFDLGAVATALQSRLRALPLQEILEFYDRYHEARAGLHQWEVCGAAYLITGYISDDSFADFQAGVIGLGRATFETVTADPDALAAHPVVVDIAAGRLSRHALSSESILLAASYAYAARNDGDDEAFWEALGARPVIPQPPTAWDGRFGAPGDRDLLPIRLPRLSAMFPDTGQRPS